MKNVRYTSIVLDDPSNHQTQPFASNIKLMSNCTAKQLYCEGFNEEERNEICSLKSFAKKTINATTFPKAEQIFLTTLSGTKVTNGKVKANNNGNFALIETESISNTQDISGLFNNLTHLNNVLHTINSNRNSSRSSKSLKVNSVKSLAFSHTSFDCSKGPIFYVGAAARMPSISGNVSSLYPKSSNISKITTSSKTKFTKYLKTCQSEYSKDEKINGCVYKKLRKDASKNTTNLGKMMLGLAYESKSTESCEFRKNILNSLNNPLYKENNIFHRAFQKKCESFNFNCQKVTSSGTISGYYSIVPIYSNKNAVAMYRRVKTYLENTGTHPEHSWCRTQAQEIAELYKTAKEFESFKPFENISGCNLVSAKTQKILPSSYSAFNARNVASQLQNKCKNKKFNLSQKKQLVKVCQTCQGPFELLGYNHSSKSYLANSPIGQCNVALFNAKKMTYSKNEKKPGLSGFCHDTKGSGKSGKNGNNLNDILNNFEIKGAGSFPSCMW